MSQTPGLKKDSGKVSLGLIDNLALVELGKVLDFGATKYSAHNWRGGIEWQRVLNATLRHVNAFNGGEDVDPETGISHMAHAMCNCMFLINYQTTHPELDNRYKPHSLTDEEVKERNQVALNNQFQKNVDRIGGTTTTSKLTTYSR
jgi:Domain of unknown function (DUF5664)